MTSSERAQMVDRFAPRGGEGAVTVSEAARQLGVCTRTVYRRVGAGQIAAYDVSPASSRRRTLRIPAAEIERLLVVTPAEAAEAVAARPPKPSRARGGFRATPRQAA